MCNHFWVEIPRSSFYACTYCGAAKSTETGEVYEDADLDA